MAVLPKLAVTSGGGSAEQSSLDPSDFASFALFCEVKLNENRAGLSEGAMPGLELVHVCFQLLQKICSMGGAMAAPLRGVAEELEAAVFSEQTDISSSERKPHFTVVSELEAEVERIRRNTALIGDSVAVQPQGSGSAGASGQQARKQEMMTQSRLMHLETEMSHMFDSVARADEHIKKLKAQLEEKNKEIREHKYTIETMRFEGEGMKASMNRAEGQSEALSQKLAALQFENASLGVGKKGARTQLDEMATSGDRLQALIAEKNAEIQRGEQERARLSFRVQELKKSILAMVPKQEVQSTWREIGALKDNLRETQREAHTWKAKHEEVAGTATEVDDVINYMTPRPDWSKVGQYASGSVDGKSSAELVEGLYRAIDEARGLTGGDADWDGEHDSFEGLGKGSGIPMYLQWVGEVPNRHFTKAEMDKFIGEIFENKKKYEKKRSKASTLSGYIPTFFSEKFGIQARIVEFGYNMMDALERLGPSDSFLEQFNLCLHDQLDVAVLEETLAIPSRCIKIWEKIDLQNEGKIGHKLSKGVLLSSMQKEWPMLSELDVRRLKQLLNNASSDASVWYRTLVEIKEYNASLLPEGSAPLELGERTPIVLILEEAAWRDRKKYLQEIVDQMVLVVAHAAGVEAAEDAAWDPMAATIAAGKAVKCMCAVDPERSEKQIRGAITKAYGKKNKAGKTAEKLADGATMTVGELGTNLSKLNIKRQVRADSTCPCPVRVSWSGVFSACVLVAPFWGVAQWVRAAPQTDPATFR